MITFAADKATARIAGEFYVNAINVMRGAASVSNYRGLPEQEAFDIEYWDLEEAKLQRMPKPKPLAGRVALITGGAGGIGLATARRLMDEGACVVICDIDRDALAGAETELKKKYGNDVVASAWVDVTREDAVDRRLPRQRLEIRRRRHLHFQRRHRLGFAGRRHDPGAVAEEHGHPGHGLLPDRPPGIPVVQDRRASAVRSCSSARRMRSPLLRAPRPIARRRPRNCTWPAASRSKARRSASA